MTSPAPCTWPVDTTDFPPLPEPTDPAYPAALALQLAAEDTAVNVLWALTGRIFGICPVTVRPCANEHQPLYGVWGPVGTAFFGWAIMDDFDGSILEDSCHGRCLISSPQAVHLPGPVYQDDTGDYPIVVTIDDDWVLDPDEFSVEGDVLFRHHEYWPRQNFSKPLGEHGTWSVSYWKGIPPPAGTARFVGCLAREFIFACTGQKCRLPASVTNISRTGVSYTIDPLSIYNARKTGIPEIDMWITAINPNALQQAPSVI